MKLKITPTKLKGSVFIKPSKSYFHRFLLAAGLSNGQTKIKYSKSDDIDATIEALAKLNVKYENDIITSNELILLSNSFNMRSSASTLRFFIPLLLSFDQEIKITGNPDLLKRSLLPYKNVFENKKIIFEIKEDHIFLKGPLKGGHYELEGHISSQFLTGLLFALPRLKKDSVISFKTPLVSKGYVDMTLSVLKQFGIHIIYADNMYYIKGNQKFISNNNVKIEGDYSQAAFFIAAGLIGDEIKIEGVSKNSLQPDYKIIEIVKQMNGNITWEKDVLIIKPSELQGITIDIIDNPDLGPILIVLASLAKGTTTILNVNRLIDKESNRLEAMMEAISKFDVSHILENNILSITGTNHLKGNQTFNTYNDHRIAMALTIASIKTEGYVILDNSAVVDKSYPEFFEIFKSLGGIFNETK